MHVGEQALHQAPHTVQYLPCQLSRAEYTVGVPMLAAQFKYLHEPDRAKVFVPTCMYL